MAPSRHRQLRHLCSTSSEYRGRTRQARPGRLPVQGGLFTFSHWPISELPYDNDSWRCGRRLREPSHTSLFVDFAETFLDYAGVPIPKAMQGRSFRPLLPGKTPADWRKSSFYAYWGRRTKHYGVRTERYKLVICHTGERELYDLKTDPQERRSEIGNPEYAAVVKEFEAELKKVMEEIKISQDVLPGNRGG